MDKQLLSILSEIPDPEIPVLNIVELGIVAKAEFTGVNSAEIFITPTYSGCPAMYTIEDDIKTLMLQRGINAAVTTKISPVWSTDRMSDSARAKLKDFGIAPPEKSYGGIFPELPKICPKCGSANSEQISRFGSTLCKASYRCTDCLEPFDYFKCH